MKQNKQLPEDHYLSEPMQGTVPSPESVSKHTPELLSKGDNGIIVLKETPGVIFATINQQFTHHAQRIVTCVNAHDELVEALRDLVKISSLANESHVFAPELEKAKAAIAKANHP